MIRYYRILFSLESPLAVGSGENQVTDKDIVRNSSGQPYIPGSSLAGVYRSLFENNKKVEKYFGSEEGDDGEAVESKIIVYDANIVKDGNIPFVTKRDMVKLDEYKVVKEGAKFDFEILEPGVAFVTYLEQNIEKTEDNEIIDTIINFWLKGEIILGGKTARGYGHTKTTIENIKVADFSFDKQIDEWLKFDIYSEDDKNWKPIAMDNLNIIQKGKKKILEVQMKLLQRGGLSIRQYSTKVGEADYEQLTLHKKEKEGDEKKVAVIPGTSWAGAFRAQMRKLNTSLPQEKFFGFAKEIESGKSGMKSKIKFSESYLHDGCNVTYSRNAIDRFTGGTVDGALYTESICYYGRTSLDIECDFIDIMETDIKIFCKTLAAAIMDLHYGYLAVGGLTSVGRGLFQVEEITVNSLESVQFEEKKCSSAIYLTLVDLLEREALK